MDIREQIKQALLKHGIEHYNGCIFDEARIENFITDIVLTNPDIKEGISLLESYKEGKSVKLAEAQIFPKHTCTCYLTNTPVYTKQQIIDAGFKLVETGIKDDK